MGFHEMVQKDIRNVFIRTDEFAYPRTIVYDRKTYKDIACVVHDFENVDRKAGSGDNLQGLYRTFTYLHCDYADLPVMPERGALFQMSDQTDPRYMRRYKVYQSSFEDGVLHVQLEAIDE